MAGASGSRWTPEPSDTSWMVADFYSDTKSRPTREMLEAILKADVGDEQKGEDPTTNALCQRVAEITGKDAAVLLPAGTMCNEIAIRVHCPPGSELICADNCHIINFEAGGPAALSGVMMHGLQSDRGRFTADQVRDAIRPKSRYAPDSAMLAVEQTTNMGGGGIWPLEQMNDVAEVAKSAGLATHIDGARIFNASVKSGVPVKDYAENFDSMWIDLTKGLGGFVGAVLAGSHDFINEAWKLKQQWGGAMRQSGHLAATGLYALEHHIDRLADDHAVAAFIGGRLQKMDLVSAVKPVETNIVIFDIAEAGPDAATLVQAMEDKGYAIGGFGPKTVRIVTHLDVNMSDAEALCDLMAAHLHG